MLRKVLLSIAMFTAITFGNKVYSQCSTSTTPFDDCFSYGDYISSFTMASVTSASSCSSNGYSFTSSPVRSLTIGTAYSWSTVVPTYYSDPEGIAIWIDINNNGQFESSERLSTAGPSAINQSGTLTVPTGTTPVNGVRMRVRACYNYVAGGTEACISYLNNWGETEDYVVDLVSPCTSPTVPTLNATSNTICVGGSSTLSIATGTLNSAANWQWYSGSCGGTSVGSGTSVSVSPIVTTTYYARGEGGCVTPGTCAQITVNVTQPVNITGQPAATLTECAGNTISLTVAANNAAGYQWYNGSGPVSNGGNISGATSANLQIANAGSADAGTYYVILTGNSPCGNLTSNNEVVTINDPVAITTQPATSITECEGNTINLSVAANNTTAYQWYSSSGPVNNGGNVSGATTANLQITNTTSANSGSYYVVISGNAPCANQNSNSTAVTINSPVNITTQPGTSLTECEGNTINLNVAANNATGYVWHFNGNPLSDGGNVSGSGTANLQISPASAADAGTYHVTIAGNLPCPAVSSGNSVVSVNPAIAISSQPPAGLNGCNGSPFSISVTATNAAGYLWYKDGSPLSDGGNISGSATATLQVSPAGPADAGNYHVEITGNPPCANVNSTTTAVTIDEPAAITVQPQNVSLCTGAAASFSVTATGTALSYQWYLGSAPLSNISPYSGTTTPTLNISSIAGLNGNNYHVVVTGCGAPATSNVVSITENLNNTWNGAVSTAWSVPGNWSCGSVPTVTSDVVIPGGPSNMPLVDIPTAICNSLSIAAAASVTFAGTNNALEVKANITNTGTFDASSGRVILSGSGPQNVPAVTYSRLDIDGGSVKALDGPATVSGILNLINGFLEIGEYDLALDAPVQTLGGSASSFIVTNDTGEVIGRNMGVGGNPDAVMFHVGISQSSYTPVLLENLGSSDNFHVRVMPNVYEDGYGFSPILVSNPVVDRTWMVDEEIAGGSYLNMNPHWNLVDQINGFTQAHVYVAHFTGGAWTGLYPDSALGAPAAGTFGSLFFADADSIQSFSPFTVASSGVVPLSIGLVDISAANAGDRNKINWNSAEEDAGDKYELQRSTDGKSFAPIATVNAKGRAFAYTYWDEQAEKGRNYYRLKLLDARGKAAYSKIVSAYVRGADIPFSLNVYPNPVEGGTITVEMNGDIAGNASVTVTDISGAVVIAGQSVESNSISINVSRLAQGVYFVKYRDDARQEIIKINKAR
jgi:hypothetical protein